MGMKIHFKPQKPDQGSNSAEVSQGDPVSRQMVLCGDVVG